MLGLLIALVTSLVLAVSRLRRRRRRTEFLGAVLRGDPAEVRALVDRGYGLGISDAQGDTALHYAYYAGDHELVQMLLALGAREESYNRDGLLPHQLAEVAEAELRIEELVDLFRRNDGEATARAAELAEELRPYHRAPVYPAALTNVLARTEDGEPLRAVLLTAIRLGRADFLAVLEQELGHRGDRGIAEDYLNSGSPRLGYAAQQWAAGHDFAITDRGGGTRAGWGRL
ncbi:ankyrin repeat domain-containing protein [Streptomyces sp. NBC_01808]|uniref:ankyrin repeat domain-containing protein n=1 Tax=Streptomyces sp. NBC_01808 TaxID=2975947 RepID=UPI002DDB5243|nr:ankyrin repeat domain-containing protein [Streptomyces sp. NBC_01808]WSA37528.1 ankyrin repeat domain-containing protein [Streptomyces sp. NBC_01808]